MAFPGTLPEIAEPTSQEIHRYLNQRRLPRTSINIAAATRAMREERIIAALPKGKEVTFTDSTAPRQIVFGQCKVPGIVVFAAMEPDNSHMHMVVAVAGHEIEDIWEVYFDGARIDFPVVPGASSAIVPKAGSPVFTDAIYLEKRYGTDDQAAQTHITSKLVGWTSVHVLYGIANAGLSLRWDPLLYSDGFPDISFIVKGMKCYDPRFDTTSFTNNAALVTAAFITNSRYGLGYSYSDVDLDWLVEVANYCGEYIGSEIRYFVNGYFLSSESRETILQELVNSMEGRVTYQYYDRKWKIKPAKFYSPKLTITLDDVISDIEISSHNDRVSSFNGVQGRFLDPNSDYEENDFPIVKNSMYAEEDGGEKLVDVRYPLVTSPVLAQRLSKIKIEKSRQGLRVSFTTRMKALILTPGDNVSLTISKYGWENKVFEVEEMETLEHGTAPNNYLVVALVLKENAPGIYEWVNGEETSHDLAPNTNLPNAFQVPKISGLTAQSGTSQLFINKDGTIISRIYCEFNEITDNFVRAGGKIECQYKKNSSSSWIQHHTLIGDINSFYIENVQDGVGYDIRVRAVNGIGSPGEWTTILNHLVVGKTAPPSVISHLSATPVELGVDLRWNPIPDADLSHYVLGYTDNRENRLLHSEKFSNTAWKKKFVEVGAENLPAPSNKNTGSLIITSPKKIYTIDDFHPVAKFESDVPETLFTTHDGSTLANYGQNVGRWKDGVSTHHGTQSNNNNRGIRATEPITGIRNVWNNSEPASGTGYHNGGENVTFRTPEVFLDSAGEIYFQDNTISRQARQYHLLSLTQPSTISFLIKMDDNSVPNSDPSFMYGDVSVLNNNSYSLRTGIQFEHLGNNIYRGTRTWQYLGSGFYTGIVQSAAYHSGKGFTISNIQLDDGTGRTDYQHRISQYEVYEQGVPNRDYISFDGTNDFYSADSLAPIIGQGDDTPYTMIFVGAPNVNGAATSSVVASFGSSAGGDYRGEFRYTLSDSKLLAWRRSTSDVSYSSVANYPDNTYQIAAKVFRGTTVDFYLDGLNVGSGSLDAANMGSNPNRFVIGARSYSSTDLFFRGKYLALYIFDRPLSGADVKRLQALISKRFTVGNLEYPDGIEAIPGNQLSIYFSRPETLFDATVGGSNVAPDGGIARVEDQSGNDFHPAQSDSTFRPIRKENILNGKDGALFNGVNHRLNAHLLSYLLHGNDTPFTMLAVVKPNLPASPDQSALWGFGYGANTNYRHNLFYNGATGKVAINRRIASDLIVESSEDANDSYQILAYRYTGTHSELEINGKNFIDTAQDTINMGTVPNRFVIGAEATVPSMLYDGLYFALNAFDRYLDDDELSFAVLLLGIEHQVPLPFFMSYNLFQDSLEIVDGLRYRAILHLKADEIKNVRISMENGFPDDSFLDVNIETGEVMQISGGIEQVQVIEWEDGYYRVMFEIEADSIHYNGTLRLMMLNDDGLPLFENIPPLSIIVYGFAFMPTTSPAKYKKTEDTSASPGIRAIIADRLDVTKFIWGIQQAGTYDVNVVAVDTSGNEAVEYTTVEVTISAPSAPQQLQGQIVGQNVVLTWNPPVATQFTVEQYEVKDGGLVLDRVKGNLYQFKANWNGLKTFTVAAIDLARNVGATAEVEVTISAPSQVMGLRTVVIDNNVLLYFDEPTVHTLPIDYYLIRKGADFNTSVMVGETSRGFINLFETLGGTYRYWVVPYDTAGNAGAEQSIDALVNQPPDFILYDSGEIDPSTYDEFDEAVLGEDEISFIAPVIPDETWEEYFDNNSMSSLQDFIDAGYTLFLEPSSSNISIVEKKIDLGVVVPSSMVSMSILEVPLIGSGMIVTPEILYSEDDGTYESGGAGNSTILATDFQYLKLRYEIEAPNDKTLSQFYEHAYRVQVKKQTDSGTVEVTSNPTTVNFNLEFLDINSIVLTPKGTSSLTAMYDFVDAPNPTEFDIYVFDKDGADASGAGVKVSWVAEGIIKPSE